MSSLDGLWLGRIPASGGLALPNPHGKKGVGHGVAVGGEHEVFGVVADAELVGDSPDQVPHVELTECGGVVAHHDGAYAAIEEVPAADAGVETESGVEVRGVRTLRVCLVLDDEFREIMDETSSADTGGEGGAE